MTFVLKLRDSDTGESKLDVVRVHEGFSFQTRYVDHFLRGLDP